MLPAVCSTCGTLFWMPNIIGGTARVSMTNVSLGPCPVCGGTGKVPDGVYDYIDNAVRLVTAPRHSVDDLERLAALLSRMNIGTLTVEQVADAIVDAAPELDGLRSMLPRTRNELYAFIALLIVVIKLVVGDGSLLGHGDQLSEADVERITREVINRSSTTAVTPPPPPSP